jgi:chromosome segregation ATPase
MYLKSLELSGFKSFAKKSSLSFTTPITSIVGPNGSGKSNTAEAFRFVLGEQSIKSLRGKRGEDMIWNGGGDGPQGAGRSNRAQVKVTFDNTTGLFKGIDFDEVSIERIVHRDNTNEYLLNGTQVRLKDIVELLATAHIGATGHHIISQGEADRILSASIRERREMIEDALGLKIYQWKKLESIRKLEKTEENMERVESLRREIAPHLKFLKKQVEKVEKAEEMRRELVTLYQEYFAYEDVYLNSERTRLENEIAGPRAELAQLDRELEKAKKILTDSKTADKKSDQIISLESKLAATRAEKGEISRELGRLEGEIAANRRAIEKEQVRMRSEESKTVYLRDVEDVVKKVESFSSIEDAKKLFMEVVSALRNFISSHRTNTDSAFIGDAEKEIEKLSRERTRCESTLSTLSGDELRLVRDYEELKRNIEHEKDTNRDAEKDVFRIIARQNEVRHAVNDLNTALSTISYKEEAFKRELGEAGMIAGREATQYGERPQGLALTAAGDLRLSLEDARQTQDSRRKQIEKIKIRLEDSGAAGGTEVMKEYRETEERDLFLAKELEDLAHAKKELMMLIADLDTRIDYEFKSGILKINTEFQKYFSLMFGGGKAELTVVREAKRKKKGDIGELSDMLNDEVGGMRYENEENLALEAHTSSLQAQPDDGPEGLEVSVSLPKKKIKGLMMLSGGERALTSIALLFAVSQVNPPPFIILDETDAALDEANSKKYGDMIENLSQHSQLILITHNRETMSRAGVLYGVTMGSDGASRLLSIQFDEAVKVAK